jgi:acyl carrier protein
MGLDGIELLMEIEKYFGIEIPDAEAEKLDTIQLMVDSVAGHLNITNESTELRHSIFQRLVNSFRSLGLTSQNINLSDLANQFVSVDDKKRWAELERSLSLSVPKPALIQKASNKISELVMNLISMPQQYDWQAITIEQFVDSICVRNYSTLIERTRIKNKYEIYVAVAAITVDKIGVDCYEIGPNKSFTQDLGVD